MIPESSCASPWAFLLHSHKTIYQFYSHCIENNTLFWPTKNKPGKTRLKYKRWIRTHFGFCYTWLYFVWSSLADKLQPNECMDTPYEYILLNTTLYNVLYTVMYTAPYTDLYNIVWRAVKVARWHAWFPDVHPSPFMLPLNCT